MLKLLPEPSNKLCSTIGNDRLRYSMKMNNLIQVDLGILLGIIRRVCLVQLWIPENLISGISCGKAAVS
jgi:hypothetical protein